MNKRALILEKNQKQVKQLKNGDVVNINHHDYFYKGIQDVRQGGMIKKQLSFWSTSTDFKRFFDLALLDKIVTQKSNNLDDGYNWS